MPKTATLRLTGDELRLLSEALNSHMYWQLGDEQYRNDGFLCDRSNPDRPAREMARDPDDADEMEESEKLMDKIDHICFRLRGKK